MEEDNKSVEFAGTCRTCGGNVNVTTEDDEQTWQCDNTRCIYNEGEESDSEPEWVD